MCKRKNFYENFVCNKEEIQQARQKKFSIFYETMKTFNPDLSDDVIKDLFKHKFKFGDK